MKRVIAFVLILLIGGSFLAEEVEAQKRRRYKPKVNQRIDRYRGSMNAMSNSHKYTVLGFSINAFNYFGDLAPVSRAASTDVSFTNPGFGLIYGKRISPWVTARGSFTYGQLEGDDFQSQDVNNYESLTRYTRNLQFKNNIYELTAGLQIDLIPNYRGPYSRAAFAPFVFVGLTGFYHEPRGLAPDFDQAGNPIDEAGQWVKLRPLGTEGQFTEYGNVETYSNIQLAIPLGLGLKIRLPNNFDAVLELGYRYLFTDYIDDVGGTYVDLGAFDSNLARAFSDRSAEQNSIITGEQRDFETISAAGIGGVYTYTSDIDGNRYSVVNGYGSSPTEGAPELIRGNKDNDMYFVTSIKIHYIIARGRGSARYR
jgi:hypothetical protein